MVDVVRGMQEVSVRSSSLHGRGAKMGPLIGIQDERNRSRASVPRKRLDPPERFIQVNIPSGCSI